MEHRPCYESICDGRSGGYDDLGPELAESGKRGDDARAGLAVSALAGANPAVRGRSRRAGDRARPILRGRAVRQRRLAPSCGSSPGGNRAAQSSPTSAAATASGSTGGWSLPRRWRRVTSSGSAAGSPSSDQAPGALSEIAPGVWGGGVLATALAPLQRAAPSDLPIVLEGETGTGKEMAAAPSTGGAAGPVRWSPSTAPRCPRGWRRASCSATGGARSPARTARARASSGAPRAGRCCSTRSRICRFRCRRSCCACWSSVRCSRWARRGRCRSTCGWSSPGSSSLMDAVARRALPPDLLARLDGLTVRLPPLRERREDVVPLFTRLLADVSHGRAPAFDSEVAERLCLHDWPFNVRELVLLVRRLLALHGERIDADRAAPAGAHRSRRRHRHDAAAGAPRRPEAGAAASTPAAAAARGEPVELPALIVRAAHGGRQRRAGGGDARDQPPAGLPADGRASRSISRRSAPTGEAAMSEPAATTRAGIGEIVGGKYRIVRLLARGGMGVVYEAHHAGRPAPLRGQVPAPRPRRAARHPEPVPARGRGRRRAGERQRHRRRRLRHRRRRRALHRHGVPRRREPRRVCSSARAACRSAAPPTWSRRPAAASRPRTPPGSSIAI